MKPLSNPLFTTKKSTATLALGFRGDFLQSVLERLAAGGLGASLAAAESDPAEESPS